MGTLGEKQKTLDWLLLILYTGVIYGTLYYVRFVSTYLRQQLGPWYSLTMNSLIASAGVLFLIKMRPKRWTSYLFLLPIFGIYAYMFKQLSLPEERIHFLEYGIMGYLSIRALAHSFCSPKLYVGAAGLTFLLGWLDEGIQGLLPNRIYDLRDVLLNGLAGVLGVLIVKILWEDRQP